VPSADVSVVGGDRPLSEASPATCAAAALLDEFVRLGLSDVVLSPGSRSQALALAAADLERRGEIALHVRVDERVAGFTALGLARESHRPVAVVCTSGTAVANLMPAAAEAHHAGVPLLLLSADRPPELRGVGANQTTRQPGIFGPWTRFALDAPVPEADEGDALVAQTATFRAIAVDAYAAAAGEGSRAAGPAHINLPLREPLAGALPEWFAARRRTAPDVVADPDEGSGALYQGGGGIGDADVADPLEPDPFVLERGPRTVVIAGADAGPDAELLAHLGSWPLIAEIVSGARFGRLVVHGYRRLLRDAGLGGRIERAIVFGRPTLSREVVTVLSRPDVQVIAVRGPGERLNLNGVTESVDAVTAAAGDPDRDWLGAWMSASRAETIDLAPAAPDVEGLSSTDPAERLRAVDAELDAVRRPLDRPGLVDAVWRATWPHDRLMFGSSRLVRVADQLLPGKKVPVHANRGVAGIDGTIATAIGIALASQRDGRPGVTRVVLGDLALLHDVGAMLLPPAEAEPRVQVIVGNDGGGTIFDGLEVAALAEASVLDRVMYTPHDVRLEHLALAYGWEYHRVTTRAALDQLLTAPVGGRQLIEAPLPR
jgi:2-succinyl-5-enolpyruvyl-6-hydroxy-3-cyclohexene-1-carboxylate synthase